MFRPHRARLAAVLVLVTAAAVATGAQAKVHKPRRHVVAPVRVMERQHIPNEDYLNVGAVPDKGSDQRYFNDTRNPSYQLGPTIFQRFQD
jgi:hypothetical protein